MGSEVDIMCTQRFVRTLVNDVKALGCLCAVSLTAIWAEEKGEEVQLGSDVDKKNNIWTSHMVIECLFVPSEPTATAPKVKNK